MNEPESKGGTFGSFLFKTFFSFRQWRMWALLAIVIAAYLINIKLAVALNDWNGRFYNALQAVDKEKIFSSLYDFIVLCSTIIVVLVTADYLQNRAALIARRVLTKKFFDEWISDDAMFYRMQLAGAEPDNPDQRISEDVRDVITIFLNLCTSFFNSVLMIGSFSVILWNLSGSLKIWGVSIPGYMFWVCLVYTAIETLLTHLIGRKLKKLNFESQHREADMRASLLLKRTHAEAIAGFKGEKAERLALNTTFSSLLLVLIEIFKKKRNLEYFSVGSGQVTHLTPVFFSLPAFFSGAIELGGLMQIRGAFIDVARSLSWIAMSYQELARFAATFERLSALHSAISRTNDRESEVKYLPGNGQIRSDFVLSIPGTASERSPLSVKIFVDKGELCVLRGPSGSGKSSILRVLAGFDQFAKGTVEKSPHTIWVNQKPYIANQTLKEVLAYPSDPKSLSDSKAKEILSRVGLGDLSTELATRSHWDHRLSGGEKQRLVIARVLLSAPEILLLDEITSALDDESAAEMIELLRYELKDSAILLVTHQSALSERADRILNMEEFK